MRWVMKLTRYFDKNTKKKIIGLVDKSFLDVNNLCPVVEQDHLSSAGSRPVRRHHLGRVTAMRSCLTHIYNILAHVHDLVRNVDAA